MPHTHHHLQNQHVNDECFVCGSENVAGLNAQAGSTAASRRR